MPIERSTLEKVVPNVEAGSGIEQDGGELARTGTGGQRADLTGDPNLPSDPPLHPNRNAAHPPRPAAGSPTRSRTPSGNEPGEEFFATDEHRSTQIREEGDKPREEVEPQITRINAD
jgi:hypothetical protein